MANDLTNNKTDATNHLEKKEEKKESPRPFSICFVAKQPVISLQPFLVKARCQHNA